MCIQYYMFTIQISVQDQQMAKTKSHWPKGNEQECANMKEKDWILLSTQDTILFLDMSKIKKDKCLLISTRYLFNLSV